LLLLFNSGCIYFRSTLQSLLVPLLATVEVVAPKKQHRYVVERDREFCLGESMKGLVLAAVADG
jgi:hypothetical protein